jgi:uncharacterized protein (DUF3820 family)
MTLPFGKHRGVDIREVPDTYLRWVLDQEWPDPWMKRCVQEELDLRKEVERIRRVGPHGGGLAIKPDEARLLRSLIDIGVRAMKPKCHPGTIKRLDHMTARLRAQLDQQIEGVA